MPRTRPRLVPLVLSCIACAAHAQQAPEPAASAVLQTSPKLNPPPGGEAARQLPIVLRAREVRGRPDIETVAEGDAEFRRGDTVIRAGRLGYDHAADLARASGGVSVQRAGNVFTGPELQLQVGRFEGFFDSPTYFFGRTGAGGTARRFDFLDEERSIATGATYTSCPADDSGTPAWLLSTDRVKLDFEANEGVADNAVLRFYGVPILAWPRLSFPLTEERKSGWLPPSIDLDSKSGLQTSIPYYWNVAPNRDATITPIVSVKRGVGADGEFRYLQHGYRGEAQVTSWPNDLIRNGESRYALRHAHDQDLDADTWLRWRALRVSDDDWWKDFPGDVQSFTPRLFATDALVNRTLPLDWTAYARVQRWQALQGTDIASQFVAPYERLPQIGLRTQQRLDRFDIAFETELNRFGIPSNGGDASRPVGSRWHAIGSIGRPFALLGGTTTPKFAVNAAAYSLEQGLDGRRSLSRVVPTFSIDSGWQFERDAVWFGRATRQTLEPRLLYVRTPYRAQDTRLNFDSAPKDFNFDSIFTENAFSGVDRVSDAHSLTAGVTTRLLDPVTGAEALRLAVVQRYLFRDQRITPELTSDPVPQYVPFTQRFSDVLLLGSSNLVPRWTLDASVQYNPDIQRTVRSILSARYSPGPYRTVSASYRLARGLSEQIELGWQWPLAGETPPERASRLDLSKSGSNHCQGSWYGVGRLNYSTRDSRVTDSIVGFEYDAGCWIGRIVSERLSTGRSEATTRLLLQLELVGLSRLGSNPLGVLKDNIPGYKLLREERSDARSGVFFNE